METMTIGKIAKRAGVGVETIRYYERMGLLEEPPRRTSGYREYPASALARLRFIKKGKQLGFSLKEIDELLSIRMDPNATCAEVKQQADAKIAEVEEKIRALSRIKTALSEISAACKGEGPSSECPILEALDHD
jgi:MerR family copper efflux transcriptional regulator